MGLFDQFMLWSGGQTGVDQGALDAALKLDILHGGWCPKGRKSEAGSIPKQYVLHEHMSAKYPPRTKQNILDTDGTLILLWKDSALSVSGPGTALTRRLAAELEKPVCEIDLSYNFKNQQSTPIPYEIFPDSKMLLDFIGTNRIMRLNVAGARESKSPGIQYKTCLFLVCTLQQMVENNKGTK